jgi:hypothetical protein
MIWAGELVTIPKLISLRPLPDVLSIDPTELSLVNRECRRVQAEDGKFFLCEIATASPSWSYHDGVASQSEIQNHDHACSGCG